MWQPQTVTLSIFFKRVTPARRAVPAWSRKSRMVRTAKHSTATRSTNKAKQQQQGRLPHLARHLTSPSSERRQKKQQQKQKKSRAQQGGKEEDEEKQVSQQRRRASFHTPASEIVDEWAGVTNVEQDDLESRSDEWLYHLGHAQGLGDKERLTEVACAILEELTTLCGSSLQRVLAPLKEEILTSVYRGYPPNTEEGQHEEEEEEEEEGEGEGKPIVPYFTVVDQLNVESRYVSTVLQGEERRREKLERSGQVRQMVLESTVTNRKHMSLHWMTAIWRKHTQAIRRQRDSMGRLLHRWTHPLSCAAAVDVLKRCFRQWKVFAHHRKYMDARIKLRAVSRTQRTLKFDLDYEQEESAATNYQQETHQSELHRSIANTSSLVQRVQQFDKVKRLVLNQKPSRVARATCMAVSEGVTLLRNELEQALFGEDGEADGGSIFSLTQVQDPVQLFEEMSPAAAEERLLAMDEEALLLCWLNSHTAAMGSQKRAANFTFDLQDSECMSLLLERTTPRYNERGVELPRFSANKILDTVVDLELRAKATLTHAEKVHVLLTSKKDEDLGCRPKSIHSLLSARDIVSSGYPDIVAAWLGDMFVHRFSMPLRTSRTFKAVIKRTADLLGEIDDLVHSLTHVISMDWLNKVIHAFRAVFLPAQRLIEEALRARRLFQVLAGRVSNYIHVVLQRRLADEPCVPIDFTVERERLSASRSVSITRYGDLVLHEEDPELQLYILSDVVRSHFKVLRDIYTFYAQQDLEDAAGAMDFGEFVSFCSDCEIKLEKVELRAIFQVITVGAARTILDKRAVLRVLEGTQLPMELVVGTEFMATSHHMDFLLFLESLIRLSAKLYATDETARTPSARFRVLLRRDILPKARKVDLQSFLGQLRRPSFLAVLNKYGPRLRKVFLFYATSLSSVADHQPTKEEEAAAAAAEEALKKASKQSKWTNTIDWEEFMALIRDIGLLAAHDDRKKRINAKKEKDVGQRRGSRRSAPKEEEPPAVTMSRGDVEQIFIHIQMHNIRKANPLPPPPPTMTTAAAESTSGGAGGTGLNLAGGTSSGSEMKNSGELAYPDFVEALTALACYCYPSPFVSLEEKLVEFIEKLFFPALRRKVMLGTSNQASAMKQLMV